MQVLAPGGCKALHFPHARFYTPGGANPLHPKYSEDSEGVKKDLPPPTSPREGGSIRREVNRRRNLPGLQGGQPHARRGGRVATPSGRAWTARQDARRIVERLDR